MDFLRPGRGFFIGYWRMRKDLDRFAKWYHAQPKEPDIDWKENSRTLNPHWKSGGDWKVSFGEPVEDYTPRLTDEWDWDGLEPR
jgi:hypothetical protein